MSDATTPKPSTDNRILLTVKKFAEKHPAFPESSLRYLIFLASPRWRRIKGRHEEVEGNGLAKALLRVGRRVLIDEALFFRWVEEQQTPSQAAPHYGMPDAGRASREGTSVLHPRSATAMRKKIKPGARR